MVVIKLALFALILALLAGAFGLPGVSEFALGLSKFLVSVVGVFIVLAAIVGFYVYRWIRKETGFFRA